MAPKVFSMTEVKKHNTKEDLWMVIHDKVYDVTKFIHEVSWIWFLCCLNCCFLLQNIYFLKASRRRWGPNREGRKKCYTRVWRCGSQQRGHVSWFYLLSTIFVQINIEDVKYLMYNWLLKATYMIWDILLYILSWISSSMNVFVLSKRYLF